MSRIAATLFSCLLIAWVTHGQAQAEDITEADKARFQSVISSQIEAFRADDGALAFSFAAPSIKGKFGSVDTFMTMVRRGYQPVYRPRSVKFGAVTEELGGPTQTVHIIGPNGAAWTALYAMERQPDGTWKISAVILRKGDAVGA